MEPGFKTSMRYFLLFWCVILVMYVWLCVIRFIFSTLPQSNYINYWFKFAIPIIVRKSFELVSVQRFGKYISRLLEAAYTYSQDHSHNFFLWNGYAHHVWCVNETQNFLLAKIALLLSILNFYLFINTDEFFQNSFES